MERVWFVLRMGGGEGLHHGEDEQARHVQVDIQDGKLELSGCSRFVLTHRMLNQVEYHKLFSGRRTNFFDLPSRGG